MNTSDQKLADLLGRAIERRRLFRRWSREHLADLACVAPNTVYNAESGSRLPQLPHLMRIARALETEPSELLKEVEGKL